MSNQNTGKRKAALKGGTNVQDTTGFPFTIGEALTRTARDCSDKGIQMGDRAGLRFERRPYSEILENVRSYCGLWRASGVGPGDKILLCVNTSFDFICAWLGAICVGAYPAAIAPAVGGLKGSSHFATKLEKFREVIGASRLLISEQMVQDLKEAYPDTLGAIALSFSDLKAGDAIDRDFVEAAPEDLAFLQFTSGSTGTPRAVQITHRMATSNAYSLNEGVFVGDGVTVNDSPVLNTAWLPMHHDMGLIGCIVFSIGCGIELSLMNPASFLARPLRYLQTAHNKPALLSGPNFGYQFCADRLTPANVEGLDLSQVASALTGSEMIRPETVQAFCDVVKGTGFKPERICPCYGMAEATLAVTFDRKGLGIRTHSVPSVSDYALEEQEVVCVGVPVPDTEVEIVNASGSVLYEDELGEIQVRGPSVFNGYYGNEEANKEDLRDGWLRIGDLGFAHNGELYIAGRSKEILVIRGDNVMPHEIEWLAEEARGDGKSAERVAAFSGFH